MGKVKQEKQTKHKRRRGSLSRRVQKVLAGIVFVLITASLVSILVVMRRERMEYTVREAEGLLNGTTNSIYSEVERYKELSRLVLMDEPLAIFLRAETDDVSIGMINEARYSVMRTFNVTENVDSVFVFREDTQYMTTTLASNRSAYVIDEELMATTEWRDPILNGKGNALVQINGDGALKRTNGHPMITITRAVYDLLRQKRTGIMMFNISNSMTERLVQENIRGENICIMGTDGTFLAGNKDLTQYYDPKFYSSEVVYEQMKMGDDMVLLAGKGVEEMPVVVLYSTVVGAQAFPLVTIYILAILLAVYLVSIIVAAIFITRNITSPVFRLTEAMEQNRQEGKIEKIEVPLPKNELGMLEDEYNNMIDHVNDLIKKLIEKEKILQNAEMRVLHEQIKPHFLYNSLETIGFLAMDAGAENVHNALETLGSFYRNFLSKGDREVSLRREVAIVQDYLSLQKLRYGDIIGDEYDIAENTKDCIVPKLILQPLIENSIYHGIRLKGEAGTIRISSFMEGDVLHLIVRDTGVGMSQEKIDEILNKDNTEAQKINEESSESFGLWGTIERIRCFCDSDDVVKIRSDEGEFTEIEFIFPHSKRKDRSTRREDHVQSDDHR